VPFYGMPHLEFQAETADNCIHGEAKDDAPPEPEKRDLFGDQVERKAKQDANYDQELEDKVRAYLESHTRISSKGQPICEWLRDGQVLCSLANKINPGVIPKVNTSPVAFCQMENIAHFMNVGRDWGVPESSIFDVSDLFEAKHIGSVMSCIKIFDGVAQVACPDFTGPHLGPPSRPDVTNDKKRHSAVQATQRGGLAPNFEIQRSTTFARGITGGADIPGPSREGPVNKSQQSPAVVAVANDFRDPKHLLYGLDKELQARQNAKFDTGLEKEVCKYVEQVTGQKKGNQTTHEWWKNGEVLCKLANIVQPGIVETVHTSSNPFKQMENITSFMNAARRLGVP